MKIVQKMLIVPSLSLVLYSLFALYSYAEHKQSSQKLSEIRDHYLPLLAITNENAQLFAQMSGILKDAVLANEISWLPNAKRLQDEIENNFSELSNFPQLIDEKQLVQLRENFANYSVNSFKLAQQIIVKHNSLLDEGALIAKVEQFHNTTLQQFTDLKEGIHRRSVQTIEQTTDVMDQLLFMSSVLTILLMILLILVTLIVSLSTHRSLEQVIKRMQGLAQGKINFSRRLDRQEKDELAVLIHWFNKLSDKLEKDYTDLQTISITDKLTQLNNRTRTDSYFPKAINKAIKTNTALACVLLDIDHFKSINDKYGHQTGDLVLQTLAQILKDQAGAHDFVGRWGGEEFIIILQGSDPAQAYQQIEQLRNTIALFSFPEVQKVTASFGIAVLVADDDQNSMIKRADECLYLAKQRGRNCVVMEQPLVGGIS
jgi:diguanylate cyclase (GGDEF)-like protein